MDMLGQKLAIRAIDYTILYQQNQQGKKKGIVEIQDPASTMKFFNFSIFKRCAREGIKYGLNLFKIRKVKVPAEEDGRAIIRTEIMILVQCKIGDTHENIRILPSAAF